MSSAAVVIGALRVNLNYSDERQATIRMLRATLVWFRNRQKVMRLNGTSVTSAVHGFLIANHERNMQRKESHGLPRLLGSFTFYLSENLWARLFKTNDVVS